MYKILIHNMLSLYQILKERGNIQTLPKIFNLNSFITLGYQNN